MTMQTQPIHTPFITLHRFTVLTVEQLKNNVWEIILIMMPLQFFCHNFLEALSLLSLHYSICCCNSIYDLANGVMQTFMWTHLYSINFNNMKVQNLSLLWRDKSFILICVIEAGWNMAWNSSILRHEKVISDYQFTNCSLPPFICAGVRLNFLLFTHLPCFSENSKFLPAICSGLF